MNHMFSSSEARDGVLQVTSAHLQTSSDFDLLCGVFGERSLDLYVTKDGMDLMQLLYDICWTPAF